MDDLEPRVFGVLPDETWVYTVTLAELSAGRSAPRRRGPTVGSLPRLSHPDGSRDGESLI
jgi:hypothetical protein